MESFEAIEEAPDGVIVNKWQQLYLLLSEWLEEEAEEGDAFDEGWGSALVAVLEVIDNLNEGKYPYNVH